MTTGGLAAVGLDRMREVIAAHVAQGAAPGLVTGISRRGEVHVEAIGVTAVDGDVPMRRDTIFRLASVTKPITAAAAMVLVESGVLRLDDSVDEHLPELADRQVLQRIDGPLADTVPAHRAITLRDLLTFRLGFGLIFEADPPPIQEAMDELLLGFVPNPEQIPAPDEWMRRLGSLPLMYQPGARWLYNTGSDVLGVLIARAAGQPLEAYMRERLFDPLGMHDTAFSVPADKLDRLSSSYWTDPASGALDLFDDAADSLWSRPPAFPSGAAGLVSTVDDLLAFGQMMLGGGALAGARVLSPASVALMMTDHLTPEQKAAAELDPTSRYWESHGWGFGGAVVTRRDTIADSVGKYGWDGGFGASWHVDPAEEMVGVLLTQAAFTSPDPPPVVKDFWTTAYAAIAD